MANKKEIRNKAPSSRALGRSDDEGQLTFNPPSPEQLWSCMARYLSFDDPLSRWQRLRLLVKRQVSTGSIKPDHNSRWSCAQDNNFRLAFGPAQIEKNDAAQLLNIVLALEDICRFTTSSFALFFSGYSNESRDELVVDQPWLETFELPAFKKMWLARAAKCQPDWLRLLSAGPWSGDARAQLLVEFLKEVRCTPQPLTAAGILQAQSLFRELLSRVRKQLPGTFLPAAYLLVEGPTEALLLPELASVLSLSFDELAVAVVPAGGANQVLRRFLELRDLISLPIICVLDRDAESQAEILTESLRDCDELHILTAGEIEDVFDLSVLVCLINKHLSAGRLAKPVEVHELEGSGRRTAVLDRLWRERGLGSFDKIGLARQIAESLREPSEIPPELVNIIRAIDAKAKGSDVHDRGKS